MLEARTDQGPDIPFELVDDDEMAAIETAFLHAQRLSAACHSLQNPTVPYGGNSGHFPNNLSDGGESRQQASSARNQAFALVYTVTSSLSGDAAPVLPSSARANSSAVPERFSESKDCATPPADVDGSQGSEDSRAAHFDGQERVLQNWKMQASHPDEHSRAIDGASQVSDGTSVWSTEALDDLLGQHLSLDVQRPAEEDIEDIGSSKLASKNARAETRQRTGIISASWLHRRRLRRGLSVTDFTASVSEYGSFSQIRVVHPLLLQEWCEKQVEFSMTRGKPKRTQAMEAGSARHLELEVEVVTRVKIEILTKEDSWAIRLLNFITGARQLLSEGLTRELPVVGIVAGTWVVGIIDEIRLVDEKGLKQAFLVDTKTRKRRAPPSEPQKRNARLQLMSYKLLWDTMVETGLPFESFFLHFGLHPQQNFCQDVCLHGNNLYPEWNVKCLQDLLPLVAKEIRACPTSQDTLLLRYEWQGDYSLLHEDEFPFEHEWLIGRWQWHLQFWKGLRSAAFVTEDETWKCKYCSFANVCFETQKSAQDPQNDG